jgi:cytochrome P450
MSSPSIIATALADVLFRLQQIDIAYSNLGVFMRSEVAARKADLKEHGGQADVFSRLVAANENEEVRGARLDDDELIGNTFLMLFAGHGKRLVSRARRPGLKAMGADTTANTLSATIAFLALYQNEQEKVYNHIRNVFSDGREPVNIP